MTYLDGRSFELGETLSGTDDNGAYINGEVLGKVCMFPSQNLGVSNIRGQKRRRSGRNVVAVALRNLSGGALTGKTVVSGHPTAPTSFSASGYYYPLIEAVDGASGTAKEANCFIVDEYLPAAGVANKDIFWGIVGGLVTVTTAATGTIAIVIGDPVRSDGAGDVVEHVPLTDAPNGILGYAMEAVAVVATDLVICAAIPTVV